MTITTKPILRVVCVKVGDKYSPDYVYKLQSMVKRHVKQEYTFHCITDDADLRVPVIPVDEGFPAWWGKLQVFKQHIFNHGDYILVLDLDKVILKDLDEMIDWGKKELDREKPMVILENLGYRKQKNKPSRYGSAVFMIKANRQPHVYYDFIKRRDEIFKTKIGDQDYLVKAIPCAVFWPNEWVQSYKIDYQRNNGEVGPDTKIICFHGHPRNHEVIGNDSFIREAWQ